MGSAELTHFLNSGAPLPIYALANLAAELNLAPARVLMQWEALQCKRKLQQADPNDDSDLRKQRGWEIAANAFESLVARIPDGEPDHAPATSPGTLIGWPDAFLPLVVFVGDRREVPPKSPADLLAVSASMGDLYYLLKLGLPPDVEIRSDKTSVIASPDSLRRLFEDKNLLIIGSPAANLVAKSVNKGACFSFHVTPKALEQASEFQTILEPIRYLPEELAKYTDGKGESPSHREWSHRRRHMVFGFARSGILDPIDYEGLRGIAPSADIDYGVVTLCKHPWSERRVAIMAAGLHGPGTAAAIKLLCKKKAFIDHPLGGVFRVGVPSEAPWEQRYFHLSPEWDSHDYSVEKYAASISYTDGRFDQMSFWNPADVNKLLGMIRSPK